MMKHLKSFKINIRIIFNTAFKIASFLFGLVSIILVFITWDEFGLDGIKCRIFLFIVIAIISFVFAVLYIVFLKRSRTIWKKGNRKLKISYGDLLKKAFPFRKSAKKIVVIPVNTAFDMIVDEDIEKVCKPLVSPKTIHGQWVKKIILKGSTVENINKRVNDYFALCNKSPVKTLSETEKRRGNRACYEKGTIAVLNGEKDVTYFLLALSEFDKDNKAHTSKNDLIDCIKKLIEFYDSHGQGYKLYLPIMGTGMSRTDLSHDEALNIIVNMFELHNDQIHGKVNIIIFKNDKGKVSIY